MARSLPRRHSLAEVSRSPLDLEPLERRDCPAVVGIVAADPEISEGGGPGYVTVTLSAAQRRAVNVGYFVSGDGVNPAVATGDYRLTVGPRGLPGRSGTIEFRPGETVKRVRVDALEDSGREGAESLRIALFRPRGCTVDLDRNTATFEVADNDDYTAQIIAQGPTALAEGEAARFRIQLTKPATRLETFYVSSMDGTATTADYRSLRDMPVMILAGETQSLPFGFTSGVDTDATETDEYFLVSARPRSADLPAVDPVGVTIRGTGPAPIAVTVSDASVVEGNSGQTSCTFTVRLSVPALSPIVVQYATSDGTATAGSDYESATGSLTFGPGQISKTVTVDVIGDTDVEDNETFRLNVSATGSGATSSGTGSASIQDDDTAFEIVVTFPDASLTPAQQQVFRQAARRWSQIIVGDLPDVTVNGRLIDDIEITATARPIDGPSNTLGQAGPRSFRDGLQGLPVTGAMEFDTADVAMMMANGTFTNVILHEMGHVIGVGTLWSRLGLVTGVGSANPQYVGAKALAEYRTLVGDGTTPTGVPVENVGGEGSRDAHWRESVFGDELMTSIAERPGVAMPISRLTVASLEDLGYRVNYAAADFYSLPGTVVSPAGAARSAALSMALVHQQQSQPRPTLRAAAFARFA